MVTIELNHDDGSVRNFNGYVFDFRFVRNDGGFSIYGMVLAPWMAFLRYRRNNMLFHGMSVEQQTSDIFRQYAASDWQIEHLAGGEVMTDACQFDESDYNYLHRRWEALGWHYHYEHRADGHTLVLSADSTVAQAIEGTGKVQWVGDSGVVECGLKTLLNQWNGRPHPHRHRCARVEARNNHSKRRRRPSWRLRQDTRATHGIRSVCLQASQGLTSSLSERR